MKKCFCRPGQNCRQLEILSKWVCTQRTNEIKIKNQRISKINCLNCNQGCRKDETYVPFFSCNEKQIAFEFWYLVTLFFIACTAIVFIQLFGRNFGLSQPDKLMFLAVLGGFLGGWVYDAKWFYRVTARGKNNQYAFPWQPNKFYWRVFTPFLAGIVAFATFILGTSDFLPIAIKNNFSSRTAFAVCFLLGYFSDLILSRFAAWAESMIPNAKTGNYE